MRLNKQLFYHWQYRKLNNRKLCINMLCIMYKLYIIATMHHLCLMTPESVFRTQLGDVLSPGPQQRSHQALFKLRKKIDSVRKGRYKRWAWWLMYLQLFSQRDHLLSTLGSIRAYLSQSVHKAFPCAHRSLSVQLLFSQIVWFLDWKKYIQVVYVFFFLLPTKHNVSRHT